ncbi:hypothetical protein ACFQHN_00390 [Natrialbaceae archaeon GCM10025896]
MSPVIVLNVLVPRRLQASHASHPESAGHPNPVNGIKLGAESIPPVE